MYNDDTHGNADMSPTCTDIFVPTRSAFVLLTKDSFVFLVTNLNIKNNVCKQTVMSAVGKKVD